MGRPSLTKTEDGRLRVTRRFKVERADQTDPATLETAVFDAYLTADVKYTNCLLIKQYASDAADQKAEVVLTQVFEQIGASPVQFGGFAVGDISGAFTGTHASTFIYVAGTTKPARSFTYQYILKGDATLVATNWLPSNDSLPAAGGGTGIPIRYYVGGRIVTQGAIYSIISRTYYELPATFAFPRADTYSFEGKLGANGNIPIVTQPPQTKQTTLEIRESYSLGPVNPDALTWEVLSWATGGLAYRPAVNNPSGVDGYQGFSFSNVIGTVTIAQTNGYFLGIKVTNVTGTVESNPNTYPTGKKLIYSRPVRWAGQIWKTTNIYVTYP